MNGTVIQSIEELKTRLKVIHLSHMTVLGVPSLEQKHTLFNKYKLQLMKKYTKVASPSGNIGQSYICCISSLLHKQVHNREEANKVMR